MCDPNLHHPRIDQRNTLQGISSFIICTAGGLNAQHIWRQNDLHNSFNRNSRARGHRAIKSSTGNECV